MNAEEEEKTSPSDRTVALSAEEELQKLQEKTNAWKKSVAIQLNEATKKNKQLREELKESNANHEAEMASLRVQLDREFRERTVLKDEEITRLQLQLGKLREEKRLMAEQHEKEIEDTATRVRETCQLESASRNEADLAQREAESRQLRDVIESKEKDLLHAEHEVAVLTARLERLGEQYKELSTLMTNNTDMDAGENNNHSDGDSTLQNALKMSDVAHQQQLEAARSELRSLEEKNASKLRDAQRSFETERQRLMDDLYQREEQLATLHTLLRQAQNEAATAQQRIAGARAEKERSEQRLTEKVAALSKELANRMEESQKLTVEVERLNREVNRQETLVRSLEEEASMREEAFTSLMLSEDSRALVQGLQTALQESREEAELWRCRYEENMQREGRGTAVVIRGDDENEMNGNTSHELEQHREALAAEALRLKSKEKMLKATEQRLEELKRSMASQASLILQQHGGDESGRRKDVDGSGKERRGGTLFNAPRRYMQMMREQQGDEGFFSLRRFASYFLFIRLRTALPLFLLAVSLFLIFLVSRRAAVTREPSLIGQPMR
ncbi:uncharacterized protein TM35_000162170 [Trypanosoma theileri]|uniref:Uncharacterized protein n=1 Tax=Trypanosoma theileri TaxID=67003 RepID=A0A1X0NWL4_9TRYP|nr:uncharacterized protein TM35_000162170 [Trypanosoma theileri]ORC88579.1 hypothetical protein TM35_000162170 [Trypanosoma theileri]